VKKDVEEGMKGVALLLHSWVDLGSLLPHLDVIGLRRGAGST